jgi:plastocyanin
MQTTRIRATHPHVQRIGASTLLSALLLALLSIGLGAAPAHAAAYTVTIKQYQFGSGSLSVQQGDTVTWTNQDEAPHDVVVTSGPASFRSPMLQKGQRWSFTLGAPGRYSYMCSVHPDMRATLDVRAKPTPKPTPKPAPVRTTSAPAPAAVSSSTAPTKAPATKKAHRATVSTSQSALAAGADVPASPSAAVATPSAAPSGLNPLLLVAGVAVAVVVFCLLLLASRPTGSD